MGVAVWADTGVISLCLGLFLRQHLPPHTHCVKIGLLREYWELEFSTIATPFPMDVERIVDDFVFFCMLIGNDFLPCEWV